MDALTILKNRGYDSAGIATIPGKGGPMVRAYKVTMTKIPTPHGRIVLTGNDENRISFS